MEGIGWELSGHDRFRDVERRASYSQLSPPRIPFLRERARVMVGW